MDEASVKIGSEPHYFWHVFDRAGEVLESFVTKKRDKNAALSKWPELCAG